MEDARRIHLNIGLHFMFACETFETCAKRDIAKLQRVHEIKISPLRQVHEIKIASCSMSKRPSDPCSPRCCGLSV